nr:zinc-binding dehydrogenase [Streptomyces graminilatus]
MPLSPAVCRPPSLRRAATRDGGRSPVLIHGGGDGVGHIAVQIAKALGAHVIAAAGGSKRRFVEELGADR